MWTSSTGRRAAGRRAGPAAALVACLLALALLPVATTAAAETTPPPTTPAPSDSAAPTPSPTASGSPTPSPSSSTAANADWTSGLDPWLDPLAEPWVASAAGPAALADPFTVDARCVTRFGSLPTTTTRTTVTIGSAPTLTLGRVPAGWWFAPPYRDPTWLLWFRGLTWVQPLVRSAAARSDTAVLTAAVTTALAQQRLIGDRGGSTRGWDEGTVSRRLDTLSCLWAATRDRRLVPVFAANAAAALDPDRYYGAPRYPAHNHGLLSNLALLVAGRQLRHDDWVSAARARMVRDLPSAFSRAGMTRDQSSSYQLLNVVLWQRAAQLLVTLTVAPIPSLSRVLQQARTALAALITPAGWLPAVGDGIPGRVGPAPVIPLLFVDDDEGWASFRPDRTASSPWLLLRYGLFRRAHGHVDSGGLLWDVDGVAVLTDPATYSYDSSTAFATWQWSGSAHSTMTAAGSAMGFTRLSSSYNAGVATIRFIGRPVVHRSSSLPPTRGVSAVRTITAVGGALRIVDVVRGSTFTTTLHLDPRWVPSARGGSATSRVFYDADGRRLTVTSNRPITVSEGRLGRRPAGWVFPSTRVARPAPEIIASGGAGTLVLGLVVAS